MSERRTGLALLRVDSLRGKIMALVLLVVLGITGLDAWLVPERAAEAERESLQQRATASAAMLADAVRPALEFEQRDTASEGLRAALADPLVRWAAIYRPDGQLLTRVGAGARSRRGHHRRGRRGRER